MSAKHIFAPAENYSAAQSIANAYEAQGLKLVDWHPSPRGGLILHFTASAPGTGATRAKNPRKKP